MLCKTLKAAGWGKQEEEPPNCPLRMWTVRDGDAERRDGDGQTQREKDILEVVLRIRGS